MDGWIVVGTKLETKDFDAQIKEVEYELKQLEYELSRKKELQLDSRTISEYEAKAEKLNNKLISLRKKQEDLNKTDLSKVQQNMEKVGNSTSKVLSKMSKWVLAIFSVRSAYMAVRNAMSTLTEYDEQLKTDLKYIQMAISTALEPIIRKIVDLVLTMLQYIGAIVQSITGKNPFENINKNLAKANGNAKELKKTLAGFDEMNILNDTSGGSGGITAPSIDLGTIDEEKVNKLTNIWDNIIQFWEEDWEEFFASFDGNWGTFIEGLGYTLVGFYDTFKGIFELIVGLFYVIVGIFSGNFELIEKGWKKMCDGMKNIVLGLIEIITGIFMTGIGIIKGLFLDLVKGINKIVIKPIGNAFSNLWGNLKSGFKGFINVFIDGLNKMIKGINKIKFDVPDWVPGIGGKKFGFNIPTIPRLAVGGVVNMPGRGINYSGANIGENGPEGVIPLTNAQMMAQLGETIGKYVNINATIPVYIGNRQVAREIKKINADSDFAFNR